jgi:DNA polymerase elongation subunit (family B)
METLPKILMVDIETAPAVAWVWGLFNQNIGINQIAEAGRTICFAAKWYGKRGVAFSSEWGEGHEEMIKEAWNLFNEADIICHYNGTKFDVPTLNREFIKYGMTPPAPFRQIDLLTTVRKQFRFQSNKLDFVCQQLGLGSKAHTGGFELWKGVMDGHGHSQKVMAKYNKQDVVLLEDLYNELLPWLSRTPNMGVYSDSHGTICIKCGSTDVIRRGYAHLQAGKYQRYACNNCGSWSRDATNLLDADKRKQLARPISG